MTILQIVLFIRRWVYRARGWLGRRSLADAMRIDLVLLKVDLMREKAEKKQSCVV